MVEVSQWRAVIGQWNNRCSTCRVSTNAVKSSSNVSDSMVGGAGPTVSVIILVLAGLLVMLSGDVELNPGPWPDVTHKAVYGLLVCKASKWNEIGQALNIPYDYRKGLRQLQGDNTKLEDVINKWIESECSEVSWDHLIVLLRGELDMAAVAKKVEEFLLKAEEQPPDKRFKPSTPLDESSHHTASLPVHHQASSYIPRPSSYPMENYRYGHSLSGFTSLPTVSCIPIAHAHTSEPPSIPKHPQSSPYYVAPTQANPKRFKPSTSPESSHYSTVSHHEASSSTQPSSCPMENYRYDHSLSGFTSLPIATESHFSIDAHAHVPTQANTKRFKPFPETSHHPTVSRSYHEASSFIQPNPSHQMENYGYGHSLSRFTSLSTGSYSPTMHAHASEPPSISKHPQLSPCTPPTQIFNKEQFHCYKQVLVGLYKRKSPSYSKKPSPFLKYINLLLVQPKKGESTKDKKACMRHKMIGDTKMLKEESSKKHLIEIDDICTTDDKSCPCLVLIKGDPGVGKTTLAWELCVRWAEGSLLQQWKIVKFIQLRAKELREAKTVELLLDPYNEHPEFCKYMNTSQGEGLLLIFDGFDELSHEQLNESSIFMRFLEGKTLSKASIIVTSRPSAIQLIPEMFMNNLDQFVEVIGFSKKDIKQYIECKFEDDKDVLKAFNDYITSHEFIFTLMYVPLHCALVTELYEEYQREKMEFEPKTLTQLYTCFIHCLIQRNTGLRVQNINRLPHDLHYKFKKLARIAAEGIEKQEYVFDIGIDDKFGMLQRVDTSSKCGTVQSVSCSFLHLTLQEYLAAYHWSTAPPLEFEVAGLFKASGALPIEKYFQTAGQKSKFIHWPALHFYSGLTGIMKTPLEGEIIKHYNVIVAAQQNSKEFNFFCLLFESQSVTLVSLVFPQDSVITSKIRSGKEAYVTGYCIARAAKSVKWEITMKKSGFIKNLIDGIKHAKLENSTSFIHRLEVLDESADCLVFQFFDYIEQISALVKDLCLIYKSELTTMQIADICNWSFNLMKFSYEKKIRCNTCTNAKRDFTQSLFRALAYFKTLRMVTLSPFSLHDTYIISIDVDCVEGSLCFNRQHSFGNAMVSPSSLPQSYSGLIPYAVVRNYIDAFGFGFLNHGYELYWDDFMQNSKHRSSILEYIFGSVFSCIMTVNPDYHKICHAEKSGVILLDINHQYLLDDNFSFYFYNTVSKKWSELKINTSVHKGHGAIMVVNEGNVELLINILTKVGAELHPLMLIGDSSELTQVAQSLNIKKEQIIKTISITIRYNHDHNICDITAMCSSSAKSPQYDTIMEFPKQKATHNHFNKYLVNYKEPAECFLCSELISLSLSINADHKKSAKQIDRINGLFGSTTALKELKVYIHISRDSSSVVKSVGCLLIRFGKIFHEIVKNNAIEVIEMAISQWSGPGTVSVDDELKLLYEGLTNLTTLKVLIIHYKSVFDELLKVISYLAKSKSPTHSVVFDQCDFNSHQYKELLDKASSLENIKNIYIREDETSTIKTIKEMTLNVNNCRVLLARPLCSANETSSLIGDHSEGSSQVTITDSNQFDECVQSLKICKIDQCV